MFDLVSARIGARIATCCHSVSNLALLQVLRTALRLRSEFYSIKSAKQPVQPDIHDGAAGDAHYGHDIGNAPALRQELDD